MENADCLPIAAVGKKGVTRTTVPGLAAAIRRFPSESRLIEELMSGSESFRSLCEDLAAAEEVLGRTEELPEAVRDARREEYRDLVESLRSEIEMALTRAKVVQLPSRRNAPR